MNFDPLRGCSEVLSNYHKENERRYLSSPEGIKARKEEETRIANELRRAKTLRRNSKKLHSICMKIEKESYVCRYDAKSNSGGGVIGTITVNIDDKETKVFNVVLKSTSKKY